MNTKCSPRELAIELCLRRSSCQVQVAAVISDKKGIFSWGWNNNGNGKGLCAEKHAILRSNRSRLKGSVLTVAGRRKKSGNWVEAKPCVKRHCWSLVIKYGFKKVEFTMKTGEWIEIYLS